MLDTDGTVCQNVGAVNYSSIVIRVTLIRSEPLEHFKLVNDSVYQVLILAVRCIVWIQRNGCIEGFLGLRDFSQG